MDTVDALNKRADAALKQTGGMVVYFGWARNGKGEVEQVRVVRGNGRKEQAWTARIFKSVPDAAAATMKLNLLPPDTRLMHDGR
jgi:hypothetical protein